MIVPRAASFLQALRLLALCSLVSAAAALGQATTGSISGHVADATGSAIPGAKISIVNTDNGLITTATTDHSGEFIVTAMPPDHYTITVEKDGFGTTNVPAFKLDIDQKARFNVPLKIGSVTTEVSVTAAAPVLQLQGAETGEVIGSREIADLPTLGRDFTTLMFLVPGVVTGVRGANTNLNISVNGQREYSNSYQINGVEVSGMNNDTNVRPSPDAIQEFKVVTSSYAPEFGRASGGAVLIQTKSGSNSIHGSDFFFYRPTATAANNNFAPTGTSPTTVQKNYGATLGGPIRKDKAFLFLGYEGLKNNFSNSYYGQTLVGQNQVTFDSVGNADLSKLKDPYTGNQVPIFDPYYLANNYSVSQFPGNIIPAADVSPAGRKIVQNLYPAPRGPLVSDPYENFQTTEFYALTSNVGNLRADYTFSQNNRFYLTYDVEQGTYNTTDPYAGAISQKGGGGADTGGTEGYENHSFAATYDHVFTPALLNEARATYFISPVNEASLLDGTNLATQYGIQNANVPGFTATYGFPQIQMGSGATTGGSTYKPLKARENVLGLTDSITWTRGRHNVKIGYDFRNLKSVSTYSLFPVPYEYFGGPYSVFTSDSTYCSYSYTPCNNAYGFYDPKAYYGTGGAEIADLILGLPETVFQGLQLLTPHSSSNEHTVYLQDYWQVTPRVNITYGLRYEYTQPWVEASNSQSNFDINTLNINIAGRGANSRSLVNSNVKNFMPRVGLAFQVTPTTVIRGGFGTFYSHENDGRNIILTQNYPFYNEQEATNAVYNYYYGYSLDAGTPRQTTNTVPATTASLNFTTVPNASVQIVNSEPVNFPTADSRNYNVTIQHQLGSATSVEVGYVGANTINLSQKVGDYNVNKHLSAKLNKVNVTQASGHSNYNSLQVKVNRQFVRGYSAIVSYTWSHNLDNGPAPPDLGLGHDSPQNPFNVEAEYGNSDMDVRNNLAAAQMIELPFGRGKHFLHDASPATEALLGGWQLNSITTLHTGVPFNIVSKANDPNYPGLRPNLTGNPYVSHPGVGGWFNPAAFTAPANQSANDTPGNLARNKLYGPGYTDEDLSLFKVFSLPHEMKFQVRIEGFNVLNTGRFGQPDSDLSHYNATDLTKSSFSKITGGGTGNQRILQFGGRLVF